MCVIMEWGTDDGRHDLTSEHVGRRSEKASQVRHEINKMINRQTWGYVEMTVKCVGLDDR